MAKIIRVKDDVVSIGMDDGSFFDISKNELDFSPVVGDEVSVYKSDSSTLVTKSACSSKCPVNEAVEKSDSEQYDGPVVNQIAYALFAIFLGELGVHKFYAGKIGMGIVYLIFCWTFIPGLIGLIEGIMALTKTADANGNIPV